MSERPSFAERLSASLSRFVHSEPASGILLLVAAGVALVWANSPVAASYQHVLHAHLPLSVFGVDLSRSVHFWINEILMTVFFLAVGMEIRREIHDGALAGLRQAALPLAAALGGVVVPALIYLSLNGEMPLRAGWAVPTATDIAFAVGVLALVGRALPGEVRVLLLALAVIDDIVAVLIIAAFYSQGLDAAGLPLVAGGVVAVLAMQRLGIASAWAYLPAGALVWLGILQVGAHPALAGVLLGLLTPATAPPGEGAAPAERVQQALHPWVNFGILPIFALANAGVAVGAIDLDAPGAQPVMLGVMIALVAGKPLGVVASTWLMVRLGWCRIPPAIGWNEILLVGLLAGIGFTMSIFVAMLAFTDANLLGAAKLGVLVGSLLAAIFGLFWGRLVARLQRDQARAGLAGG
jgi:Na+:H+ antiporter, NhaA family